MTVSTGWVIRLVVKLTGAFMAPPTPLANALLFLTFLSSPIARISLRSLRSAESPSTSKAA
ncbi:MAG: hypothetical protein DME02_07890 [Candidatus Rokuibacteriota bacterium]|nr:MAG: hypothetical protein DME02_07890 [Candidatus Rokubacteria bacterium]